MSDSETKLLELQACLETHFGELRSSRSDDQPIFALEHCLDEREIEELSQATREHVRTSRPSIKHSLPWIVYSSELGYRFSGDEYWQTFEQETPGWTENGNRYWLRARYLDFEKTYGGAVPSGTWADHFSIICWPITHAILPNNLQRHLARILWETRNSFSKETLESPEALGELVYNSSWNASSHFRYFVQNKRLAGQIAAPLLFGGDFNTDKLIRPETLERIGKDLNRERISREWLKVARSEARRRVNVKGLASSWKDPETRDIDNPRKAKTEAKKLGIEPRLLLRPEDLRGKAWTVRLEIPDMSHLPNRFPGILKLLAESRCVVEGTSGRPLARGMLLRGAHSVRLERWPDAREVLLKFERENKKFNYLLQTECLLRPDSIRLFRIASDGLAYEMRSPRVRPGENYVLINTEDPVEAEDGLCTPTEIRCEGVHGAVLKLPEAISSDLEETLKELGIGLSGKIEIRPAGLCPVAWDGDGRAEWLASETPCLAIRADHAVDSITLSIDGERPLELVQGNPGEPVFVEFPYISAGRHVVRAFSAAADSGEDSKPLGDMIMYVLPRRTDPRGPLFVQIDPPSPTLEDIWEGRAEVSVFGPNDRTVECRVSMFGRSGESPITTKRFQPMELPVSADEWRSRFEKSFRKDSKVQRAYCDARFCKLEFSAEELGMFSLLCEEDSRPLRWRLRQKGRKYFLRVLDDSGDDGAAAVSRVEFDTPLVESSLASENEYEVPGPGGMYIARTKRFEAAVIIPPPSSREFQIAPEPSIEEQPRRQDVLVRAVETAKRWADARPAGNPLAAFRQSAVVRALVRHVFRILCGNKWADKEKAALEGDMESLKSLSEAVSEYPKTGSVLLEEIENLAQGTCGDRVRRLAGLFNDIEDSERLAEFLLMLASDPRSLTLREGESLDEVLKRILDKTTPLTKAARFLVLATDSQVRAGDVGIAPGEIYAGWRWP